MDGGLYGSRATIPDAARSIVTLSNPQTPFAELATHRRKALRHFFTWFAGYSPRRRRKRTVAHASYRVTPRLYAKRPVTKHGRPLTARMMNRASSAVSPVRAILRPSLRSKRRDHGPIERETLICGALDCGNERRSRAFLVW